MAGEHVVEEAVYFTVNKKKEPERLGVRFSNHGYTFGDLVPSNWA